MVNKIDLKKNENIISHSILEDIVETNHKLHLKKLKLFLIYSKQTGTLPGAHNDSSCSSGPDSPHINTENSGEASNSGRAQYVSASCVVFTHYSGDAASVVDEHFTRALNFSEQKTKGE